MHLPLNIMQRLATDTNRRSNFSMGEFEITAAVAQVAIIAPYMIPLYIAQNRCNNTATMGWADQLSTSRFYIMGALLCSCAFTLWIVPVTMSNIYQPRAQNHLNYDNSQRWDLTYSTLLSHFNLAYPQLLS